MIGYSCDQTQETHGSEYDEKKGMAHTFSKRVGHNVTDTVGQEVFVLGGSHFKSAP